MYYLLTRFFPIPACSDKWLEVGEDISEVRLAYDDGSSDNYDVKSGAVAGTATEQRKRYGDAEEGVY